jgi:murein DD-endopeptidase MepM/ murein hydrolase activator NlpD
MRAVQSLSKAKTGLLKLIVVFRQLRRAQLAELTRQAREGLRQYTVERRLMTNPESSEGSSNPFTTTYTYDFDFSESESLSRFTSGSFAKALLISFGIALKTVVLNSLKISWEAVTFITNLFVYAQKKSVAFVFFLEGAKDTCVSLLMWRRGLLFRPTIHGSILVLASLALIVGSLFKTAVAPQDLTRDAVLAAANTPETIIPQGRPRSEVIKYTVKGSDTLSNIASAYNVSADSIKWANNLTDADSIKPGDTLAIPPVTGVLYVVKEGDSFASIAQKYEADPQTIVDYPFNYIDDSLTLRVGQTLVVPGGKVPPPKPVTRAYASQPIYYAGGSGILGWPVTGIISQYPSWFHPAVDIAAPYGSPVYATADGIVTMAGWGNNGFGNQIHEDTTNGFTIIYAHLSAIYVSSQPGKNTVTRGQEIGAVGCSGRCTGPHLHFQVMRGSQPINPLSLLP